MSESADGLIEYTRENGRVCPLPLKWQGLMKALTSIPKQTDDTKLLPPLILGGWHYSTNLDKMLRLADQIKWADLNGKLDDVSTYLRALVESEWHHFGD